MANFPWRNNSANGYPGFQVDGYKACPFCNGIDLHFPTSSLFAASSGRPPGELHKDQEYFEQDPMVTEFNQNDPYRIPLNHFTLDPYDSITGFPTYNSWRCLDCNRSFESPAFVPGNLNYPGYPGTLDFSGFQGETKGEDRAQF